MINTCCDITVPIHTGCGEYVNTRQYLTNVPEKYRLRLNIDGWVDVPMDELLPGNMYATKDLIRITLIK